ncbi:MAG: hypothetical protein JXM79_16340 [Sedimentisphaerales bacterium]|nr:hypothetical protein [Sedimentisphaerales bacterium]
MKSKMTTQSTIIALTASLILGLGSGCCCENTHDNCGDFRLHPVFEKAVLGAIIGGIVGYQSHEEGEGAAIGAGLFVVGELLQQIDKDQKEKERAYKESRSKTVTVEIHNDNGSITPVKLKKKDGSYIGPKGERYDQLPTEEQLKPLYGL